MPSRVVGQFAIWGLWLHVFDNWLGSDWLWDGDVTSDLLTSFAPIGCETVVSSLGCRTAHGNCKLVAPAVLQERSQSSSASLYRALRRHAITENAAQCAHQREPTADAGGEGSVWGAPVRPSLQTHLRQLKMAAAVVQPLPGMLHAGYRLAIFISMSFPYVLLCSSVIIMNISMRDSYRYFPQINC